MENGSRKKNTWLNTGKQLVLAFSALALLVLVSVLAFLWYYNRYDDALLYSERLSQMQEVTEQLFSGLEDIVSVQWEKTDTQCRYLNEAAPETVEEMVALMERQARLNNIGEGSDVIAVDAEGRFYTQKGKQGLAVNMRYLEDRPPQVSYVYNEMTTTATQMLFLNRLDAPLRLRNGDDGAEILYYGLALNMDILNPYFACDAYGGNNSTYVVDEQGLKLFSGSSNANLLKGFNVFTVLRSMEYLHHSSFSGALETMRETGLAYSNAVLDGEEYYYALYRMDNSEWILVFLIPSAYVATNTVRLVKTTTRLLMAFAVLMALVCGALIYLILRALQRKALHLAEESNAALEAGNRELERAQAAMTEALKVAESASKAKSDFLANMSHDIRTPMNAIVGLTKLMDHDRDDPERIGVYIGKIQQSSQHLLSLINDVLDMSRIEAGEVTLNVGPISVADQLGQVESIMRPQVEERRQTLTVATRCITHEHLIGDAVRLRQVFINLLSNAIKYTPDGGSIRLELAEVPCVRPGSAMLRISVTDNGYGMSPEFLEHIFEPFTRAENSTTNRVQGTGLGMAITRSIVDLAGGTISVCSEVGRGSCFTVEMPFLIDTGVRTELPVRSILLLGGDATLVANAQAAVRETDVALLTAATEAEAENILGHGPVGVVLLGGDQLAADVERLRRAAGDTPLLYCCTYEEREQLRSVAENGGVDGVLARPLFLSNLAIAIERARSEASADDRKITSALSGMRFLSAEDNELNAEILQAVLDMNGASCVNYPDGKQLADAFAAVKPGEFDAILMDVQMPVMDGMEATREIRHGENPLGRTIPIIAMTASAFSEDVRNCLEAGMDAHVAKPLDIAALERALKSVISGMVSGGTNVCH